MALNEGTGSSQASSFTATFRNPEGKTPKAIAPLEFDQRHTFNASIDIRAGKNEGPTLGGLHLFENAGANFLITYNSGRPYTPVAFWDVLTGNTLQGNLTQYVNSAYADGVFRIDLKVDKEFYLGNVTLTPYLWIQNLTDRDNFINVWRSTGEPDNTAYLESADGQRQVRQNRERLANDGDPTTGADDWELDYRSVERDPTNYGIPRLVRLGLKVKF